MQPIRLLYVCLVTAFCLTAPAVASAQDDPQALRKEVDQLKADFETLRQGYAERLAALEARLAAMPAAAPEGAQVPQAPAAAAGSSKVFNPDISVIGNFAGAAGDNPLSDQPALSLSEVEAAFQAVVDPYARADFFLSASPEGLEVEEANITFTSLPAGLLLKVGKMRAQFGKVNAMHTHILPWTDRPLVLHNLFGGDEGISDSGASLSKLIPNRFMFLDAIGEVYLGASDVFHSEARSELNYLGRLRGYRDLTEGTNLDLGVSFAHGPSALSPGFDAQRIGMDATFRYRPLRRAIYRQLVGRAEGVWSREELVSGLQQHSSGFYGSVDYQFARRWFAGVRGDRSGRPLDDLHDSGGSLSLTFRPSEFSLIRGQYRRTHYGEDVTADELLFQLNFSIGAHGAHPF